MSRPAVRKLAAAIRADRQRGAERQGTGRYRGIVTALDPLSVDVAGLDMSLDDEDITIGDALAARVDDRGGLAAGDTLVLLEMDDDDFVAVDLLPGEE